MDPSPSRWRVVLADDHTLLLEALTLILEPVGSVVATAKSGPELVSLVLEHTPDLVITDLSMPGGSGFSAVREICALEEAPPVIVLTVHDDPGTLEAAMQAGAQGYVVKSAASTDLLQAVRTVMGGSTYRPPDASTSGNGVSMRLTPRQHAVIRGLVEGLTSKQIAQNLGITERTVVFHRQELRKRLGVRTPQEMIHLLSRLDVEIAE